MASVAERLSQAVELHRRARLTEARPLYEEILRREPNHADAIHLLGLLLHQQGNHSAALRHIHAALRLAPKQPMFLSNLGAVYQALGRWNDAEVALKDALQRAPDNVEAHNNLGNVLRRLGRSAEALAAYEEALRLRPDSAEAHNNQGVALCDAGRLEEARAAFERSLACERDQPQTLYNLGNVNFQLGRPREAADCYRRALAIDPRYPDAARKLEQAMTAASEPKPSTAEAGIVSERNAESLHAWGQRLRREQKRAAAEAAFREALSLESGRVTTWLALAGLQQEAGRVAEAHASIDRALELDPGRAESWHALGMVLRHEKKLEASADAFQKAFELDPGMVSALNNRGNVLREAGRNNEAREAYQEAIRRKPDYAIAHNNLGIVWQEEQAWKEAEACYTRAAELDPHYIDPVNNLGTIYKLQTRYEDAERVYRRALELRPAFAPAHCNLGFVYERQKKYAEAEACFREAIRLRPDYAEAHNNLGVVYHSQERLDEAEPCYRRAIEHRHAYPEAHNNLGTVLKSRGENDAALACYETALKQKPEYAEAYNNLGNLRRDLNENDEALRCYNEALRLRPDYPDAAFHRSLIWLLQGDFARGWPAYESRFQAKDGRLQTFSQPGWDGSPLEGKTILLHSEQGLGDTFQFIRYAEMLERRGARVLLKCPRVLVKILSRTPGIHQIIPDGSPLPDFDFHCALLSLPGLCGTELATIPVGGPYITPDPELSQRWKEELAAIDGFKVAISWQGNPKFRHDRWRSVPLKQFERLADIAGVRLFSVQKKNGREQLAEVAERFPVIDWTNRMDEQNGPFMDTAALLTHLDLLITSDTAVAHLAGALGVPTWLLTSFAADWRWLLDRDDSPWYPTLRLFRQNRIDDWDEVFDRMRTELSKNVRASQAAGPLSVPTSVGELLDKISILEIKEERISDPSKLQNVRTELAALRRVRDTRVLMDAALERLCDDLKGVNATLWDVEDELRDCERLQQFDTRFIELARSVYHTNDRRAALKKQMNQHTGSSLVEEKSYASYGPVPEQAAVLKLERAA